MFSITTAIELSNDLFISSFPTNAPGDGYCVDSLLGANCYPLLSRPAWAREGGGAGCEESAQKASPTG